MFIMRSVCLASLAVGSVQLLRAWIMDRITPSPQKSTVSSAGLLRGLVPVLQTNPDNEGTVPFALNPASWANVSGYGLQVGR